MVRGLRCYTSQFATASLRLAEDLRLQKWRPLSLMAEQAAGASHFHWFSWPPSAVELRQRQAQMHPAHTVGLENPSLTQGLLEHLPNICPEGDIISITPSEKKKNGPSGQEKSTASVFQGCFLDKHPWKEFRTKVITRHAETKWRIAPWQHIVGSPHYSQFCIWECTYSPKFICNPKINMALYSHLQAGAEWGRNCCLTLKFPAKAK